MDRRGFLVTALAVLAAPRGGAAQPPPRARVGFLTASGRVSYESGVRRRHREAFTGRLRELGWIEGQNLVIESRYAEGQYDRLPVLAAELVRLPVDVIFANAAPSAEAAKRATTSIPIVFETLGDPITAGLVGSLARPGGNLTGISGLGPELSGKRLELLREALPGLRRVVLLLNPGNVMAAPTVHESCPTRSCSRCPAASRPCCSGSVSPACTPRPSGSRKAA
jgi:putative ABC transport system substrate-binding protein